MTADAEAQALTSYGAGAGIVGTVLGVGSFFLAWFGAPWPLWFVPAIVGPLLLTSALIALAS